MLLLWVAIAGAVVATHFGSAQNRASRSSQLCAPGLAQLAAPPSAARTPAYVACVHVSSRRSVESRLDLRYGAAANTAAVCWSARDWTRLDSVATRAFGEGVAATGGFVWDGQRIANLPPRLCRILDRVMAKRKLPFDRWTAWAFKNLTHEALHVAGVDDEAKAECFALQRMAETVRRLGFERRDAERLARVSWSRYQRLRKVEPRYFSTECRNDGTLDLSPRSPRWPTA
jgi:hypothetical protein